MLSEHPHSHESLGQTDLALGKSGTQSMSQDTRLLSCNMAVQREKIDNDRHCVR